MKEVICIKELSKKWYDAVTGKPIICNDPSPKKGCIYSPVNKSQIHGEWCYSFSEFNDAVSINWFSCSYFADIDSLSYEIESALIAPAPVKIEPAEA